MNRTTFRGLRTLLLWLLMAIALLILLFLTTPTVYAADIRTEESVTVLESEIINDDLIVAGDVVQIDGTINGDATIVGTRVAVNGIVNGNLVVAAQSLTVNGTIVDSIYLGATGATFGESAVVGRSVYAGGFSLDFAPGSRVDRSVYAGGYQVLANGTIGRNLYVGASALQLNGMVAGDVLAEVDPAGTEMPPTVYIPGVERSILPTGLDLGSRADVGGELRITEAVAEVAPPEPVTITTRYAWLFNRVGEFVTLLLVGAALLYFARPWIGRVEAQMLSEPLPSLGWGFIIAVIAPFVVAAAFGLMLMAAIGFGIISFGDLAVPIVWLGSSGIVFAIALFTVVALIFTKIIVVIMMGQWLVERFQTEPEQDWATYMTYLGVGALLFEMLRLIPGVGGIVTLAAILFGLGAMFLAWRGPREMVAEPVPKSTPQLVPA